MTPIEQLFKKIFDRKCRIESQLRQHRESYAESLGYSLLADGKQLPSWLLESQNELSSNHIAPGISCPLPTPLASEICISKEYIHKEHADVPTIMGHQKDDQRGCNITCSEVVEDSLVSDSVVSIRCGKSKQKYPGECLDGTKQIAKFGDEVTVEGNARRLTRSMATPLMLDSVIEPSFTRSSLNLHNKVGDKAASPRLPKGSNPHRITRSKQKGSEEYLNGTKQIANFGDEVTVKCNARRITRSMARSLIPDQTIDQSFTRNSLALHSKVGDKAALPGSSAEHNPCSITMELDSSLMPDHAQDPLVTRNSFGLQSKIADEMSSSRSLDRQLSSPSEYLSTNPHDHKEKIHSRSCKTSHDLIMVSCGMACTSDSHLKQSASSLTKHTREEDYKTMTVDESGCSLNAALHDLQIDNSVNTCPESEETDFAAPVPNLGNRMVNSPLIVHDAGNVTGGRPTATSGSTQPKFSIQLKNHSSESRYSLRSLSRNSKELSYSDPDGTSNISSSKRSRNLTAKVHEISWPKRRKLNCYSESILATTPRTRLRQFMPSREGNCCSSKRSLESASFEEIQKISPSRSMLNCEVANSEKLLQRQNQCGREVMKCPFMIHKLEEFKTKVNSCSKNMDQVSDTCLPNQCTNIFPSLNLADESRTSEICNSGSPLCILEEPGPSGNDTHDGLDCSTTNVDSCDLHTYSSVRYDMVNKNEFMPEFEGFSIGTSPTLENDVYSNSGFPPLSLNVQKSSLISLVTPTTSALGNYKKLPDVFQSLPDGFLENVKFNDPLYLHNDFGEQFRTNEHAEVSLLGSSESAFDFSFMESSYSHGALSSGDTFDWTSSKPPLTPPIGKSSLRRVSGKSASSSQTLATNPELVCFRIDEDSTTLENNEYSDELGISGHGTCSKQVKALDDREPLKDVSSRYRNAQNSCPLTKFIAGSTSVQSLDTKFSCATEINVHSSLGSSFTSSMDQVGDIENQCYSVNGDIDRNMAKSLSNRSSEPEINTKKGGKNQSQASIQKGYKPSNIVSNVSSFIPMIKKKQQTTTTKGKKEIKVKALEAAEAAKRLEEKKQNEREIRKAAAKLERERLEHEKQLKQKQLEEEKRRKEAERLEHEKQVKQKQEEEKRRKEAERLEHEKQLKQKQEEEKRKKESERLEHEKQLKQKQEDEKRRKEAELAARKRQREEDQKEKDRKRRCNEEARKLQREQDEKLRAKKEEKELRSKAPVDDGKKKGLIQEVKQPLLLKEPAGSRKTDEVETAAPKVAAASADIIKGLIQDRLSTNRENQDFESYEISPYKDSDDDDDGADESLRSRKYIPSWTRGEPLKKILLGQQDINPFDVFSRKSSFSLNQVLCPLVARRWPM